jgi:ribosomal protein S12 methylthiotransferase accessory factor
MSALEGRPHSCEKAYRIGTQRHRHPGQTIDTFRPLMARLGITRIADLTGLDCLGIPVVQVVRPNGRSLSVAQGKGVEYEGAVASGLGEAIESWHAEHIEQPLLYASFDELQRRRPVVDIRPLARMRCGRFHRHLKLLWVEGLDLVGRRPCWVPYESVSLDCRLPLHPGAGSFHMSSNGLASGNTLLEATSHALCELVERDGTSLFVARPQRDHDDRRIDLDTICDPSNRALLDIYRRAGMEVGVWETTTDVGLPAFRATIIDRDDTPRRLGAFAGEGCHLDRDIALSRALTEAAQDRLTHIAASRDDLLFGGSERKRDSERHAAVRNQLRSQPELRPFGDAPTYNFSTFADDVDHIVRRLVACGLRQIVRVDLTNPDLGVPVVRMVVPGLEPSHEQAGYVPGMRAAAVSGAFA